VSCQDGGKVDDPRIAIAISVAGVDQVSVERQPDGSFSVAVGSGPGATRYSVTVPVELPAALGCGHVALDDLVRASFGFLLEREPATSILQRFSLNQISDYFPEYESEIRRRLGEKPTEEVDRGA
jgi:hypothetical protein